MRNFWRGGLLCMFFAMTAASSFAQVDAGAINQSTRSTLDYYRAELFPDDAVDDKAIGEPYVIGAPASPGDSLAQADNQMIVKVSRIVTNSSEILGDAELRSVLDPYENRELTMGQLVEAAEKVQSLYHAHGRLAARAFVPAQEVNNGVVRIQLVEARLEEVSLENSRSTDVDYVRSYIRAKQGELVAISELEQDLRRFNSLHDAKLKAALAPGSQFGTTSYQLTIDEPPLFQALAFVDNAGREDVGLERIGFSFAVASFLGYRDRLALAINLSDEWGQGTKGGSLAYSFPLNTNGTRVSLTYDRSNVVVISGPIEVLNVRGDAANIGFSLRQSFLIDPRYRIDTYVSYADKESSTDFDDVELFDVETKTITVGADFHFRHESGGSVMSHQVTSDWKGVGGDNTFQRYNGEVTNTRFYAGGTATTLRARVQLSSEQLLPSTEQFQLGGIATVRGYDEGLLIGDDGYFLSAEVSVPWSKDSNRGRSFFFLDHGAAFPFKGNNEGKNHSDYLTSVGAGVDFSLFKRISGRLTLGFPLDSREDTDGRDNPRLHFFVQSATF